MEVFILYPLTVLLCRLYYGHEGARALLGKADTGQFLFRERTGDEGNSRTAGASLFVRTYIFSNLVD